MSQPVYVIAQIDVKDHEIYMTEYGMPVLEQFNTVGAEVLVATPERNLKEGDWPGNWTVVVRFPSAEVADAWYHSEEYAPHRKARIDTLSNSGTVTIVPGLGG